MYTIEICKWTKPELLIKQTVIEQIAFWIHDKILLETTAIVFNFLIMKHDPFFQET